MLVLHQNAPFQSLLSGLRDALPSQRPSPAAGLGSLTLSFQVGCLPLLALFTVRPGFKNLNLGLFLGAAAPAPQTLGP